MNLPEPPFVVSLTKTYKKTTWQALLRLNGGIADSKEYYPVGFDYNCCYIEHSELLNNLSTIDDLLRCVTKKELLSGELRANSMKKLVESGLNPIETLKYLRTKRGSIPWEIAVFIA